MIRVQTEAFDVNAEIERLRSANPRVGAIACFIGVVRDLNEGSAVASMTLEHYPGMTEKALESIVGQARASLGPVRRARDPSCRTNCIRPTPSCW